MNAQFDARMLDEEKRFADFQFIYLASHFIV